MHWSVTQRSEIASHASVVHCPSDVQPVAHAVPLHMYGAQATSGDQS
jgi:hypothetical protein